MTPVLIVGVTAFLVGACGSNHGTSPAADPPSSSETTSATALSKSPAVDPFAGAALIDHVTWTTNSAGRQLRVYPTTAGRQDTFPAARDRAWHEVVADAPTADTPGMRDQFYCHWDWARLVAPDKPSWDLEPWRPDVGYQATVAALCNPGGPEGR